MASGFAGDPVYGQPYTGTPVPKTDTFPKTQTVLDMNKQTRVTITRTATDHHIVASGIHKRDLYHE